jgi:hypothetical protein
LGQEILQFERIEAVSEPMCELIEDLWPELVHKLAAGKAPVIGTLHPHIKPSQIKSNAMNGRKTRMEAG